MSATATTTQHLIDALAHAVVTDGLAVHRVEIGAVADQARTAGVPAVLVETLLDETEPQVVRERALGAVTRRLAALLACDEIAARVASRPAAHGTSLVPALI